jgi:hypothetical protein
MVVVRGGLEARRPARCNGRVSPTASLGSRRRDLQGRAARQWAGDGLQLAARRLVWWLLNHHAHMFGLANSWMLLHSIAGLLGYRPFTRLFRRQAGTSTFSRPPCLPSAGSSRQNWIIPPSPPSPLPCRLIAATESPSWCSASPTTHLLGTLFLGLTPKDLVLVRRSWSSPAYRHIDSVGGQPDLILGSLGWVL